jgi:hypothetical protein
MSPNTALVASLRSAQIRLPFLAGAWFKQAKRVVERAPLVRDRADWDVVQQFTRAGKLVELEYQGHRFYMRALPSRRPQKIQR